jgi:AcrR family transcriptional regulator
MKTAYHHGDLANSLIKAAVSLLESKGAAGLSLREVARIAGVSHGAPAHHFGDKQGLLTAVAIEGYEMLAEQLVASQQSAGCAPERRLIDAGYAYIQFALSQTAYFEVMFHPDLTNSETQEYVAAANIASEVLENCVRQFAASRCQGREVADPQIQATVVALWSQVHGFANLWLAGNFGDPADHQQRDAMVMNMLTSITPRIQ